MAKTGFSDFFDHDFEDSKPKKEGKLTLEDIFEEEPVSLDVFVQDSYFYGGLKLSPIQYDLVQHMERIYLPETYELMGKEWAYWNKPIRMTNYITAQWGKGGGKDTTVRVGYLRIAYLLLCLKDPTGYFGMPDGESIHMLNIAANADQANNVFFAPLVRKATQGWFKDRSDAKKNQIDFAKGIIGKSGHSSAETQEGLNLLLGVADEVDAFPSKTENLNRASQRSDKSTVEYMLEMLRTSASSRFPVTFKNVRISYPRYLGSVIQQLTDEAKADIVKNPTSRHYVSGPHSTWDVNPSRKKIEFIDEYEGPSADPEAAAAKYDCMPARAIATYFRNVGAMRDLVEGEQPIQIDYVLKDYYVELTNKTVKSWTPEYHFNPDFQPIGGAVYAIHVDLAVTGDRAGVSMSHVKDYAVREYLQYDEEQGESTRTMSLPIVRNDFTIAYEAKKDVQPGEPMRDIQVRWARELVAELIRRGFAIGRVTYDGFQSVDSLQILESQGIEVDKKSTDRVGSEFWKNLKDISYESRLTFPKNELLMNEIEALGQVGNKIDHPPNGSKDLADAFAISIAMAVELGGMESDEIAYPQDNIVWGGNQEYQPLAGVNIPLPGTTATSWW